MSGLIHIYTGDGKGKTTASIGLSVRAASAGYKVVFSQFMKTWETAEKDILESLDAVTFVRGTFPRKFSNEYTDEDRKNVFNECNRMFKEIIAINEDVEKRLLVFDEIIGSFDKGFIDREMVLDYLKNKPENTEVVLTGRNPSDELKEIADYISEIKMIKHPYEKGINARKGIEF